AGRARRDRRQRPSGGTRRTRRGRLPTHCGRAARVGKMAPMSPQRALVVALAGVLVSRAAAQVSSSAVPIFHGTLDVNRPAGGTLDRTTGQVKLRVNRWTFMPVGDSDGIFPSQEPVLVALGEDSFRLEPGSLVARRAGRVFTYRAPKSVQRGVRTLRMWPQSDGTY